MKQLPISAGTVTSLFSQVEFSKKSVGTNIYLKLVQTIQGVGAVECYQKLADYKNRKKWDILCKLV